MTALMTGEQIAAARRAALERLKSGRRSEYRSYTEAERRQAWLEARELPSVSIYAPEYREPENVAEWLDDLVITWGRMECPERALMVTLAEAAREGLPAAVRALGAARDLAPAVQWSVFRNLRRWDRPDDRGHAHGERLAAALLAEWGRLRLPEQDPAMAPEAKRRQRPWERRAAETEMEVPA